MGPKNLRLLFQDERTGRGSLINDVGGFIFDGCSNKYMTPLNRFIVAQAAEDEGFATALGELRAGRKTSHWIWYVFPQLAGLGRSTTARFYGLADPAEARAYLGDPVLREHLLRATEVVAQQLGRGIPLPELMGGETDSLKLVSSLTLFEPVRAA